MTSIPITLYKCKHCKSIFDTKQEALDCEKRHLEIRSAQVNQYMKNSSYPLFVDVVFANGEQKLYMLEDEVWRR